LLPQLGDGFVLLACASSPAAAVAELPGLLDAAPTLAAQALPLQVKLVCAQPGAASVPVLHDVQGLAHQRLDLLPGTCYLVRPDQHVVARWRRFDPAAVQAALRRATRPQALA
jgi:3-(3-hydroxy-phenyl)propionate hydroxylase